MASKVTFDLFHYLIPTRHFMLNIALALFLVQELKMNGMRVLSLEAQQKPNSTLHHGDGTHKHKKALDHCKKVASSFLASSLQIYIVLIMQMTLLALLSTYYFIENTSSHKRDGLAATRACLRASTKMVLINGGLLILSRCSNLGQLFGRIFSAPVPDPVKRGSVHKLLCQCSVLFISLHVILWWALSAIDCSHDGYGFLIYLKLNILAGTGWSGHGLLLFVGLICIGSLSLTWASPFSEDWVFPTLVTFALLGAVHGTYSRALVHHQSHVSNAGWILVLSALILYLLEMALGLQATGSTSVFKIIRHPSGVLELHLRKGSLRPKVGQTIRLCFPHYSSLRWFTYQLLSAPEEDYLAIHLTSDNAMTTPLSELITRQQVADDYFFTADPAFDMEAADEYKTVYSRPSTLTLDINMSGPYGKAFERVFNSKIALVVADICGVISCTSLLKSLWYRSGSLCQTSQPRKVYFVWICHEFSGFEWFKSLLLAIEAQDIHGMIEFYTYFAAKHYVNSSHFLEGKSANAFGLERGPMVGLPDWNHLFESLATRHRLQKVDVFYTGERGFNKELRATCKIFSNEDITFKWNAGNL